MNTITAGYTKNLTVPNGTASAVLSGVAADCDDSLGSLVHGVTVTRDGAVAADAGCTSAGRGLSGTFYARRHTFTLDAAARVSVDLAAASDAAPLDAYVVLYRGHDAAAAAVLHSDDDSGPGSDSRLRNLRLGAGDYTIEATTAAAEAVGGYRLGVRALYSSPVRISGLTDASGAGTGAVTVSEPFTVSPSTAACTATPDAASVAAGSGRRRTVSATLDAPGPVAVTVTCSAAGRGPARQQATLTHAGALTSITARTATSGGECETARTRRGIDAAYRCRIGRGNTVTIAADATATGPGVEVAWGTTGAITATGHRLGAATPTFGPDNSIAAWKRTATVDLACTANGTATAKATLAGTTAKKTARLTVVCADAVQITGLEDTSAEGTGTVPVTRGFTVTPSTAKCTADPATARVTKGIGDARTLSGRVAVPATLEVTVTCKATGYADAVRQVALTARRPCSTHLGTLATGTITSSGNIADDGCVAKARKRSITSVFYARQAPHWAKRHTFTLDTPGWVTISLGNAPANAEALDTYLVLLKDDNNTGTPIERNDDRTRRDKNARLTGIFLQPGRYTIEATTKTPRTAGSYNLDVEAVVSGLQDSYTATVGTAKPITFHYWPPGAQIAVKSAANEELQPAIVARAGSTYGTATITLTPKLVHTHEDLWVRVRHNTATEQLLGPVTLTAQCPSGETPSINNNVLCLPNTVTQKDKSGSAYRVTPGTLNGILATAEAAVARRPSCGLSANKLAAFMLSIGFHEVGAGRAGTAAPSPMVLGRKDTFKLRDDNLYNYVNDTVLGEPRRAFFHPGVGWWQLDDEGDLDWRRLNHGQRADTGLGLNGEYDSQDQDSGGEVIAEKFVTEFCPSNLAKAKRYMSQKWFACRPSECADTYDNLYIDGSDDLHVTVARNVGQYSTDGGVTEHSCRWANSATALHGLVSTFGCFWYDTTRPQGGAGLSNPWSYLPNREELVADEDELRSPLAAPFVAFTHDVKRFAVFPGPVMTVLKPARHSTSGAFETWIKEVPQDVNVRNEKKAGAGLWSAGGLDRAMTPEQASDDWVLEVRVCDEPEWVLATGARGSCRWLGVDEVRFASQMGFSGVPQPGGVL
ncbi:hypothetical protein [Candidatus Poriferisodalis sp.]|uniref:hypothetical protein n=1 Tax=Candidatus Poriferisodalis sp. TaxID=3101277 RepID=UPI003B01A0CC